MKRTVTQAMFASIDRLMPWKARMGKQSYVTGSLVVLAMVSGFFLGRGSVSMPGDFSAAVAGLKLDITLQQREIDRLARLNRSSTNALAARMAELQAASTRIDALGERLVQMGQLALDEFDFGQAAAVGGPVDPGMLVSASDDDLRLSINRMGEKLQRQASQLDALQFLMVNRQLENDLTPSGWPVRKGWISSRYGERNDPFSGQRVRHNGLDFAGSSGTDVLSVASGVVVWAANRSGFGKTVEIDHGNGYRTRYAHNESLLVAPGTHVTAGQLIAKMGSTGRSSAPHLHFEVLQNGIAVNPAKFVEQLR
jgi:murein DD-endopeptidase MepM/ murein hydrolase activator NlpD